MAGVVGQARNSGNDTTIQNMFGGDMNVQSQAVDGNEATIVNMGALRLRLDQTTETNVTSQYHIWAKAPTNFTGANVTNSYVLRAEANTLGTTNYGVYIAGAATINALQGSLVIGALTQSAAASQVELTGNCEIIGSTNRLIVEDTDGSGDRYECFVTAGVWSTNLLP